MAEVEAQQPANTAVTLDPPADSTATSAVFPVEKPSLEQALEVKVESEEKPEQASAEKESAKVESTTKDEKRVKDLETGRAWNERDRTRGRGGRGGKHSRENKQNIKSDLTTQEESSDPVAIRKQVEFYFSDSNLLTDRFLFERCGGHKNLPVPISIIHSFKRMRHFQPLSAVIAALKDSNTLNVVDNDSCIQRKYPLPESVQGKLMADVQKVYEDEAMAKSIYVKGFGDEEPGTQFDVEAFFAEFGPTNSVRLRRTYTSIFKGSVFVEFDSEETQKKFLALDPQPKWRGKDLLIKSKKQYCDDKVEDINAGRIRPREKDDEDEKNRSRQQLDDRDWRTRRAEDQANGFRDRHDRNRGKGGRRGFGSSGQRGRGDRGRRGGRDRNAERNGHAERNEHDPKAPTIQSTDASKSSPSESSSGQPKPEAAGDILPKAKNSNIATEIDKQDAPPPNIEESKLDSATSMPATPSEESKKRSREDDETTVADETRSKLQKVESVAET